MTHKRREFLRFISISHFVFVLHFLPWRFVEACAWVGRPAVSQWLIPLNAELNPICHLLALLEAHHILHVSRIRDNLVFEKNYVTYRFCDTEVMEVSGDIL